MSRRGSHGGATVAQVAAELGVHENTVTKTTRRALARLELVIDAVTADLEECRDPLLLCVQRLAYRSFCERLMACRPGDYPDDDPPRCV